jgi:hypothetical protein
MEKKRLIWPEDKRWADTLAREVLADALVAVNLGDHASERQICERLISFDEPPAEFLSAAVRHRILLESAPGENTL